MKKQLNYKKMCEAIDKLVSCDFLQDMEMRGVDKSKFTQKDARQMEKILSQVYGISHCCSCTACRVEWMEK